MTVAEATLEERIAAMPYWYHRICLPGGIETPGWAPLIPEAYRIPQDLNGKRVLDVGAWDGYWTFEALHRGASQVVAIDDFSDQVHPTRPIRRHDWDAFDLCRDAFDFSPDVCVREEMNLYDITPERFGVFDIVFFFGTLYHLRYPLLGLDRLSAVCTDEIFIESAVIDRLSAYHRDGYHNKDCVMEFYPENQYAGNPSNWWAPTLLCLGQMLSAAGFREVNVWHLIENPTELYQCRGFARGRK